jgi:hypothetical protein
VCVCVCACVSLRVFSTRTRKGLNTRTGSKADEREREKREKERKRDRQTDRSGVRPGSVWTDLCTRRNNNTRRKSPLSPDTFSVRMSIELNIVRAVCGFAEDNVGTSAEAEVVISVAFGAVIWSNRDVVWPSCRETVQIVRSVRDGMTWTNLVMVTFQESTIGHAHDMNHGTLLCVNQRREPLWSFVGLMVHCPYELGDSIRG